MAALHTAVDVPDYLRTMAPDAMLKTVDVCRIFGFVEPSAIHASVSNGCFPPPDKVAKGFRGAKRAFWRADTIRSEIKRRAKVAALVEKKGGAK